MKLTKAGLISSINEYWYYLYHMWSHYYYADPKSAVMLYRVLIQYEKLMHIENMQLLDEGTND